MKFARSSPSVFVLLNLFSLVVLAIANHKPTSIPRSGYLAKRVRSKQNDCTDEERAPLKEAFDGAPEIFKKTIDALEELKDAIKRKSEDYKDMTPREEAILRTFKVVFGPVYSGPDKEDENEKSIESIDNVQKRLVGIRNALNDPEEYYLDIWCDDGYLRPESEEEDNDAGYWDTWTENIGGLEWVSLDNISMCKGEVSVARTMTGWLAAGKPTNMVFRKWYLTRSTSQYMARPLPELLQANFPPGRVHLEMFRDLNVAFTMTHELGHCDAWVPYESGFRDFCRDEELQEDQYGGWDDIPVLREDRGVKINRIDADSMAFFAFAMYFDQYDWHTGFNQPLPTRD